MTKNLDPSFSGADWNVSPEEPVQTPISDHRRSDTREPVPFSLDVAWLPASGRPEPYEIDWLE